MTSLACTMRPENAACIVPNDGRLVQRSSMKAVVSVGFGLQGVRFAVLLNPEARRLKPVAGHLDLKNGPPCLTVF